MGLAEFGSNVSNWAAKIGDTFGDALSSVNKIAVPVANLYGTYLSVKNQLAPPPPKSSTGSAIVPGEIPAPAAPSAPVRSNMPASSSAAQLVPIAIGLGALVLLAGKGK